MLEFKEAPPLTLYIHFPWCVKKCPYCDFNSHALKEPLPEQAYIAALLNNLDLFIPKIAGRKIISIFMGGGTPSLFSAAALAQLLKEISTRCEFADDIEITCEANPGTVEQERFKGYHDNGINRLSLGVQSFHDTHLKTLGRIHNSDNAKQAIETIQKTGFTNFNIDLMFGLPDQTINEALLDLQTAISFNPTHLSWYELTIEPNTAFWHAPPPLPHDDILFALQEAGQQRLAQAGLVQYEVSAYSKNLPCRHNLNYWEFGDYVAIGAGSHGKITDMQNHSITRYQHFKHPKQYMDIANGFIQEEIFICANDLPFEYLLNALRLKKGVALSAFAKRTGLPLSTILSTLQQAEEKQWLQPLREGHIVTTERGYRFLNDVTTFFLPL